ncbi:hypothetical protein [Micromonospora tarensis]|uniref:Uncharacterized protein n=1 Tax=Micromonospora tarensis TaxID=2806100 RepID=A0ABS1YPM5_9ACTN|nr:hypothetical protein [Micromonospora tarensis]MBM0279399.1 hypothetical protein [Micromonospora tarensis]
MYAEPALLADPQRSGHEDVNVVGEIGRMDDTVQMSGRRASDHHSGR